FYSSPAQAKIRPPRTELARLTVNEYRQAIADLIGPIAAGDGARGFGFRGERRPNRPGPEASDPAAVPPGHGLRAEYFNSEKRKRSLAFARVDPRVDFDLNQKGGDFEKLATDELAALWQVDRRFLPTMPRSRAEELMARWEHAVRQATLE
ncbi:MAG: hypothetical protein N2439_09015, partial [Anaerolineae bacterium]|nr:hypothetical protein [Anaerolineae bacterium]